MVPYNNFLYPKCLFLFVFPQIIWYFSRCWWTVCNIFYRTSHKISLPVTEQSLNVTYITLHLVAFSLILYVLVLPILLSDEKLRAHKIITGGPPAPAFIGQSQNPSKLLVKKSQFPAICGGEVIPTPS